MRKQWLVLLVAVLASAALWGCGSSGGSGGSDVTDFDVLGEDADGNAIVSTAKCIECHETISWSSDIVEGYLAGKHVVHSDHINAEAGDCLQCHDPYGDGPGIEELIDAANVPAEGLAAVGCESCHGGGGNHFGVGPMPIAKPGIDECATCHDNDIHHTYHPEADFIASKFLESRHFTASVRNEAICSKCHTDEGGRLYKDVSTKTQLLASVLPVSSDEPVQCKTCHDPHNAGGLLMAEVEDHGHVVASAEYATCATCHMSDREDPADNPEWMYHDEVYYRVISDTHYDDPATANIIEGYVIDPLNEHACRDCHDVHAVMAIRADDDSSSFSNTINDQWSKSPHGGFIGNVKLEMAEYYDDDPDDLGLENRSAAQLTAIKEAGTTDAISPAWTHYNWDSTFKDDGVTSDRGDCQECHTATGAMNYLNDPENYDFANNDFSHLDSWDAVGGSTQNELLYCWGCHSNNSGDLRNPGATSRPYTVDGVNVTMPDAGNSNVCINCHGARGNVEGYALTADPSTLMSDLKPGFGPGTKNVTNAHYLVASATLYAADTKIGYEYSGQSYAPVPFFAHDSIALNADSPETGAGPCVACHMQTSESHTFEVVEKDDGVITALTSTSCVECHTGGHGAGLVVVDTTTENGLQTAVAAAAFLEEEAEGYHEALEILNVALAAKGLDFAPSYPYFSGDSWIDEGTFGAAHNYNYLHHEPGAYAHNRYYAKRLIFDSLDWLDNGVLDGMIAIDATEYPEADAWLASGAARP